MYNLLTPLPFSLSSVPFIVSSRIVSLSFYPRSLHEMLSFISTGSHIHCALNRTLALLLKYAVCCMETDTVSSFSRVHIYNSQRREKRLYISSNVYDFLPLSCSYDTAYDTHTRARFIYNILG